uniref:hypothetical protein n=1 Tax=Salmonella enterica TaxID=28901 RepID=UPI00398C781E
QMSEREEKKIKGGERGERVRRGEKTKRMEEKNEEEKVRRISGQGRGEQRSETIKIKERRRTGATRKDRRGKKQSL